MKHHNMSALIASALVGLALAAPAFAQNPPPPGGPPPGGGFGGQRRMPFAFGTVSAVDKAANTITISTQNGDSQVIKVGTDAQIVTQQAVKVEDLKVGDKVTIQGIPTGITASQITVGDPPAGLPGPGGFGGGGRGGANGGPGGGGNAAGPQVQGFATGTGQITALPTATDKQHLTVSLGPDATLYLKLADGAKLTRYATVTLDGINTGDRIIARGQTGDDGTLTATMVGVNMQMGGGGFGGGGFGGGGRRRGGGGGFGGPGGGPGGPGGFGGPGGPPPPADGGAPPPPQ